MLSIYISTTKKYKKDIKSLLLDASDFRVCKYNGLKNDENKLQSIVATHLIDVHLHTIGLKEKNMVYAYEKYGKPYFKNYQNIHFSISHSKNIVVVAFSDKKVGVDIQVVRSIDDKIYKKVLNENELLSIDTKVPYIKKECFFYYWVQKEAFIKRDASTICSELKHIDDKYNNVKRICQDNKEYNIVSFEDIKNINDVLNKNCKEVKDIDVYYLCANNLSYEKENIIFV